jgi:hypothetical protein
VKPYAAERHALQQRALLRPPPIQVNKISGGGRSAWGLGCCKRLLYRLKQIFEAPPFASPQGLTRSCYSGQKLRVILQAVIQPILVGFETNQDPRRPTMPGNQDLLPFC